MNIDNTTLLELLKKKELRPLLYTLLPFILIIIGLFAYLILNDKKLTETQILDYSLNSKVKKIFTDSTQHNTFCVEFNNNVILYNKYRLSKGDSVSKLKQDSMMYIFRGDSIIKINLLEKYRNEH